MCDKVLLTPMECDIQTAPKCEKMTENGCTINGFYLSADQERDRWLFIDGQAGRCWSLKAVLSAIQRLCFLSC